MSDLDNLRAIQEAQQRGEREYSAWYGMSCAFVGLSVPSNPYVISALAAAWDAGFAKAKASFDEAADMIYAQMMGHC